MALSIKNLNSQEKIEQMLLTEPLSFCTNWLYHHGKLLRKYNIITGEEATKEIKNVAIHNVAKGDYINAINDVCRLNDIKIHQNGFYSEYTYEFIPVQKVADIITQSFEGKENR